MAKLAVLDIGTNSIHLYLAEVDPDFSYKIVDRFKDMTRLGDGVFASRRLSEATMSRGMDVIRTLVTLARNKGYQHIEAVATSAIREARNGGEFIEGVARQTGLRIRVVTGKEEARLIYLGVRHSIDLPDAPTMIVDIGGGSVELVLCKNKNLIRGESLKLGAIRLKDLFLKEDPPRKSSLRAMGERVKQELTAALRKFKVKDVELLIATSGMVGNLSEVIHLSRSGRPLIQLNLSTVTLKDVRDIETLLAKSHYKNRLEIPGLDPKRVDTLLPSATVIRTLMELAGVKTLTITDKAIREGLIYDFIERNREGLQAEREIPNVRLRQVISLARKCQYPEGHSHHVAYLSLQLFDQTRSLHGLGEREREWLQYAAILHDIGYVINARRHHKHTHYLISHSDLHGLSAQEIEMIAHVARYHRKGLPRVGHASIKQFSPRARRTLEVLSAVLRIADGLDRSHFHVVQEVTLKLGKPIVFLLMVSADPELEIWTAQGRADLFEKVFKKRVEFRVEPFSGDSHDPPHSDRV